MDAITIAKLFLLLRPIRRIRKARNRHRLKKGKPLLHTTEENDVGLVLELLGSLLRTLVPAATAYLAGLGISVDSDNSVLVVGIALIVYVAMQAWSMWRKISNKPRATE
jgi:hypothetical protein